MKIGIDARLWGETGVGRYIRNLVFFLQKIDEKNSYVIFVRKKDRDAIIKKIYNHRWRVAVADIHWHTVEEQLQFPNIIKKESVDLMHFPYFSVPAFYTGPFIVTIHDLIIHHFSTGEASTLSPLMYRAKVLGYKFVIKRAAEKAEKIIAVSKSTRREVIDHLQIPEEKIAVIYEGVDQAVKKENAKKIISEPYFLHVGNVYPHKNMDRFLSAFKKIPEHSNVKLVLVGKEDFFMRRLKEYARKREIESSVLFAGEMSDADLSSMYHHAVAVVIPSLMEGFGLPALEAMANDCVVLASDIPSLREVCGDAAIYFNPNDTGRIAASMQNILGDQMESIEERRKKGKVQAKKFSWEKMAKETKALYEGCTRL